MKTFLNVLGCIFASLLSIVLVLVLLVFPVYRSAASFVSANTITDVIQNIDFTQFLPSSDDVKEMIGDDWESIPVVGEVLKNDALDQVVNDIVKSDAVGQLVTLYADDVVNQLKQTGEKPKLTVEALKKIVTEEGDSLATIIKPYMPADATLTHEELVTEIQNYVFENAQAILDYFPNASEFLGDDGSVDMDSITDELEKGDVDVEDVLDDLEAGAGSRMATREAPDPTPSDEQTDPLDLIRQLVSPSVSITFIIIIVILVLLIALCRFNRFGGMLWLGIDTLIAALPVALLAAGANGITAALLLDNSLAAVAPLITSVATVLSQKLAVAAIIYVVIGIALIVGYCLLRKFTKAKTAEQLPAETVSAETAAD